ncbi:MAG: DGPFAETKE family protein, partial [uncultured Nocardioides sp.]
WLSTCSPCTARSTTPPPTWPRCSPSSRRWSASTTSSAPRVRGSSPAACTPSRRPPPSTRRATGRWSPTAPTSRARSSSAASGSSRPPTSTPPSTGRPRARGPARARWRSGPSRRT